MPQKRILVAPLNWGLGHATRCIPIIRSLIEEDFEPVIATDGQALELLKKEFPYLEFYELPSYKIKYARNGMFFRLALLFQTPHILNTIKAEEIKVRSIVEKRNIQGIISDNRWGVRNVKVPSVFITHQIKVFSGFTTWLSSKIQQNYIKKFDECWVPDRKSAPRLSGRMTQVNNMPFKIKHIGILSRLSLRELPVKFDIAVILSGPEPQRNLLEKKILKELKGSGARVLLVKGIIEEHHCWSKKDNITICNFLTSTEMEEYLNCSELIVCRSGYSSIMDLAKMKKKAFLIPTPGQYEQEYLLSYLKKIGLAEGCSQKEFSLKKLERVKEIPILTGFSAIADPGGIFALFKGE